MDKSHANIKIGRSARQHLYVGPNGSLENLPLVLVANLDAEGARALFGERVLCHIGQSRGRFRAGGRASAQLQSLPVADEKVVIASVGK